MKKILLFLLFTNYFSFSQKGIPKSEDSLLVYLKTKPKTDTMYYWAMRRYANIYLYTKPDFKKTDSIASNIEVLATKLPYGQGIYFSHVIRAINRLNKGNAQEALVFFEKGLETVDKYKLDLQLKEASISNMSLCYEAMGQDQKAIEYSLKAIEIQEKAKFKKMDPNPYGMIGYILKKQKKYKEALVYYEKELKIAEIKEDPKFIAASENKIANIYLETNQFEESQKHFKRGLELAEKAEYLAIKADFFRGLGLIAKRKNNFVEAENYFLKFVKNCRQTGEQVVLQNACFEIGNLYLENKKFDLAQKYLTEAYELKKVNENFKDNADVSKSFSTLYEKKNDYKKAYDLLIVANIERDSANKIDAEAKANELLTKYETEKKEAQIKLLNEEAKAANFQRNAFLIGGILIALLAGLGIFSISNQNKLKRFEEQQKLRNRIAADLHDEIGSTLSSISILSEMVAFQQQKGTFKPEIMQQVSDDARVVISKMDDIIWTINPENDSVQNLETRLKTFAIPLFESKDIDFKFDFTKEVGNLKIDMSKRRDIYLILKEAINNLVKYSQCKNVIISSKIEDKSLIISVNDDGIGFDTNAESVRNGQRNMRNRAEKIGGDLAINSEIGKGTEVALKVGL